MGETKSKKKASTKPSKWVKFMQKKMHEYSRDPQYKGVSHKEKMQDIGAEWAESDENPKNQKSEKSEKSDKDEDEDEEEDGK